MIASPIIQTNDRSIAVTSSLITLYCESAALRRFTIVTSFTVFIVSALVAGIVLVPLPKLNLHASLITMGCPRARHLTTASLCADWRGNPWKANNTQHSKSSRVYTLGAISV